MISPTRLNIHYILDFLGELFEKRLKYRTIGTHRSAISVLHDPTGNIGIGSHPRVSALMPGLFNKRPPQPKYPFIWDVETVSDFLRKLPENDLLSDKLLYTDGLHIVSIVFCIKGIRDHKFESGLFGKTFICLHICYSPSDKDLSEAEKAPPQSDVLQFRR